MKKLLGIILGNIGSIASIIALFFIDYAEFNGWKLTAIIIGVFCGLGLIVFSLYERKKEKPIVCKTKEKIESYMKDWVSTDGKIVILSRNLTWVNSDIKTILKGKGEDITIFAQKETPLTKELVDSGCCINYYGDKFEPKSRFTIIRANKPSKQLAIFTEKKINKKNEHIIHETKDFFCDIWLHSLSEDLIKTLESISEKNK